MAADNTHVTGNIAHVAGLSHDVWYLVFQHVNDRNELFSLSQVCKGLYPLATRSLYKLVVLGPNLYNYWEEPTKPESRTWVHALNMVRRLAATPNPDQTRAVREIEVKHFQNYYDDDPEAEEGEEQPEAVGDVRPMFKQALPGFVMVLPNLRKVRLSGSTPKFNALIRALHEHPNKPEIELLDEDGLRRVSGPLPGIVTLRANVNPFRDTVEKPNTVIPDIQKLLFACTNLKFFALSMSGNYGGCMGPRIHHRQTYNFEFTSDDDTPFPPLESLSIEGYEIEPDNEWPHWRDRLDWARLETLSLGPDPRSRGGTMCAGILGLAKGHATALRSLTVKEWASEREKCLPLEDFLMSFDTLEELTIKQPSVPVSALISHSKLKRLCLHCIEVRRPEGTHRPTLDAADLNLLDASCPDLETLEIDIARGASKEWPESVIKPLATSFRNLRRLTLHCEVGIEFDYKVHQEEPFLPLLDETLAEAFAKPFFVLRGASKLEKLTLMTGEDLRRFPQWPPAYKEKERSWSAVVDIWPPREDGQVAVKERLEE